MQDGIHRALQALHACVQDAQHERGPAQCRSVGARVGEATLQTAQDTLAQVPSQILTLQLEKLVRSLHRVCARAQAHSMSGAASVAGSADVQAEPRCRLPLIKLW